MFRLWLLLAFSVLFTSECVGAWSAEEFTCSRELCQHGGQVGDFTDDSVNGSDEKNCK